MSWLRNLQGQLTELANEVLNEATEEIADPESELQVASKKAAEAEKQLASEKSKIDLLEKRCANLEQNLLDSQTELEMGRAKYENIISSRDQELKRLRIEIEQLRASSEEIDLSSPKENSNMSQELLSAQKQVELLKEQKELEISAIMEQHSRTIQELRESYEEKLRNLEASFPASTSQSGISIIGSNVGEHPDLAAVHDELENLSLTQSGELQCDSIRREETQRLESVVQQLTGDNLSLSGQVEELKGELSSYESLKRQTQELTRAYNDLNTEYEAYKENNGGIAVRNQDLIQRIDTLRANLIEYEERYEQCRREHSETEKQLQQLTEDFTALRDAVDKTPIEDDLLRMKEALELSKTEGNKLKNEVEVFRDTVVLFEGELEELRIMNKKLIEDNEKLSKIIRKIQDEPSDEKYTCIMENMKGENEALRKKNDALEEKIVLMEQYQSLTRSNESGERERVGLLEDKIRLLEQVRDSLKERVFELEAQRDDENSLDSLTNQLKEALAANSEKTDECERLRAEVEEHKKEINLRQNCVDELIVQNNLLQVQYQEAAELMNEERPKIANKERQILKLQQEIVHMTEEKDAIALELEQLKAQQSTSFSERPEDDRQTDSEKLEVLKAKGVEEIEKVKEERETLKNDLQASHFQILQLQAEVKEAREKPDLTEYVNQLASQNEELRRIIAEKHEESIRYYGELQNVIAQMNELKSSSDSSSMKVIELEEEIKKEQAAKEVLQKDLARLKAHLIHMEESTTAEAIEAEKREMDLRALVSELQKSHHSVAEDASEHSRSLELRVADMTLRLDEAEKAAQKYKTQAEITEKLRQETADALQSLQGVLREISSDHEKESASLQHANEELNFKLADLSKTMAGLVDEIDRLKFEKQAGEDEIEAVHRDIVKKQRIIEDLENQMEELKSSTQKDSSEYRIDDSTLRSLFLSYFLAPTDKKADIAILLANILQYSKEDIEKISSSLFPNGKSAIKSRNTGGPSLTEQFVRFLENESESSKTAPQLPVDRQSQALAPDVPSSVRVPPSSLDEILK